MEEAKPEVSDNLSKLREIINLQVPAKSVRWEVFGTPEHKGGVPGPTDFVTLVAEIEADQGWLESYTKPTGITYIAPEAARSWISNEFRTMLAKNRNKELDLSSKENCRWFGTTLKKTGKPVDGFVCGNANKILLYITLESYGSY